MSTLPFRDRGECFSMLAATLDSYLREEKDLVVATYRHIPVNPGGISPFVSVVPLGSNPQGSTARRMKMSYLGAVYWFVLYSSKTASIDEATAWGILDNVSREAFTALASNYTLRDWWVSLEFLDVSQVDVITVDNHGYLMEVVPIQLNVF